MDQGFTDYAVLDMSIVLEGDGPHLASINDGKTVHAKDRNAIGRYALLASDDPVAVDATAAHLINVPHDDIKALRMYRHLGLGRLDDGPLVGATLDDLCIADWKRPTLRSEDVFEPVCPKT